MNAMTLERPLPAVTVSHTAAYETAAYLKSAGYVAFIWLDDQGRPVLEVELGETNSLNVLVCLTRLFVRVEMPDSCFTRDGATVQIDIPVNAPAQAEAPPPCPF